MEAGAGNCFFTLYFLAYGSREVMMDTGQHPQVNLQYPFTSTIHLQHVYAKVALMGRSCILLES